MAIQDQVVHTRNYQKYVTKDPGVRDDRCRKCREKPETIQHITAACSMLSQNDFLYRHNQVAAIVQCPSRIVTFSLPSLLSHPVCSYVCFMSILKFPCPPSSFYSLFISKPIKFVLIKHYFSEFFFASFLILSLSLSFFPRFLPLYFLLAFSISPIRSSFITSFFFLSASLSLS
jgi:hypothetical protein